MMLAARITGGSFAISSTSIAVAIAVAVSTNSSVAASPPAEAAPPHHAADAAAAVVAITNSYVQAKMTNPSMILVTSGDELIPS